MFFSLTTTGQEKIQQMRSSMRFDDLFDQLKRCMEMRNIIENINPVNTIKDEVLDCWRCCGGAAVAARLNG